MNERLHPRAHDDPRPVLVERDGRWLVRGFVCTECGYRLASARPRCPLCRSPLAERDYGPGGVVWAATILRTGVPDRTPPLGLAYVDLEDGPRVLCHFGHGGSNESAPPPGTPVRLIGLTEFEDPNVEVMSS